MVPIESIMIHKRKRPLKDFEALKNSIKEVGLLNLMTIYRDGLLVAGYHRLEACKALGWKEILAINIEDDNLKAEQLMSRKEIYEIKYPETTRSAIALNNLKLYPK